MPEMASKHDQRWFRWHSFASAIRLGGDPFARLVETHLRVVLISAFASVVRAAQFSRSSHSRLAKGRVEEAMGKVAAGMTSVGKSTH